MTAEARLPLPGLIAGAALAPFTALGSYLRHARVFHPCGICLRGEARAIGDEAMLHAAGGRLEGHVFARFSGGFWKTRQWPDVLGCALRFTRASELASAPRADDQDLLLATIRNPVTTLLAPLRTRVDDYLSNAYFGVSPFEVPPLGRVKLRLSPSSPGPDANTREERLMLALVRAPLAFTLEARPDRLGAKYQALARIELVERIEPDQRALRFDPFASGRAFVPRGFVHALRVAAYAASRRARGAAATTHEACNSRRTSDTIANDDRLASDRHSERS